MSTNDDQLPPPGFDEPVGAAELEQIEALLTAPGVWAEPAAGLEAQVLGALRRRVAADAAGAVAGSAASIAPTVRPGDADVTSIVRTRAANDRASRAWRTRVASALIGVAAASLLFAAIAIARRPAAPKLSLAFTATELVPGASGTAKLTETNSGWQIKLDTHGLERLDGGRFYEAWLEGPKGIVSIGTFHTGAAVTLWAGVEADEYTTLAVTIEREDGDPSQSSARALTAPLQP